MIRIYAITPNYEDTEVAIAYASSKEQAEKGIFVYAEEIEGYIPDTTEFVMTDAKQVTMTEVTDTEMKTEMDVRKRMKEDRRWLRETEKTHIANGTTSKRWED